MPICVGRSKATDSPVMPCDKQIAVAAVAFLGRAEAGVLAHGPEAAAVHVGIDAARERKLARQFAGVLHVSLMRHHEREILRALRKERDPEIRHEDRQEERRDQPQHADLLGLQQAVHARLPKTRRSRPKR